MKRVLAWFLAMLAAGGYAWSKERSTPPQVVRTAVAEQRPVGITLERPGTLVYRNLFRVYNQEEGRIEKLPWDEGDRVPKGALLLQLDSRLLEAEKRKAEAQVRLKQRSLTRLEKLLRTNAASSDQVIQARTELEMARAELAIATTRLSHARVTAPFDGILVERLADPGDVESLNTHLLTLADPASLAVRFHLDGPLLAELSIGQKVEVTWGDQRANAKIVQIFPLVDETSRLGQVEALFAPPLKNARAGDFVRVHLTTPPRPRLLVPFSALRVDRHGEYLYLVEEGKVKRQPVRSGYRFGNRVEILEGLNAGQRVVTRGFLGLEEGATVSY